MEQKSVNLIGGLSWFLAGVGTGLALGVVFAAQSGEESHPMIQKKLKAERCCKTTVDQGPEYIKRQGNELLDKANELIDQGKNAVKQKKDQLSAVAEAWKVA